METVYKAWRSGAGSQAASPRRKRENRNRQIASAADPPEIHLPAWKLIPPEPLCHRRPPWPSPADFGTSNRLETKMPARPRRTPSPFAQRHRKRAEIIGAAAGPYPPAPIPTNTRAASNIPMLEASPDAPLARHHRTTAIPIIIQREKRSASQPSAGAAIM